MEEIKEVESQQQTVIYDEENIRHLSDMEHVRTRPGMYIGRLGDGQQPEDGIYVLLKEVIDNSIDEFKMNAGKSLSDYIIDVRMGYAANLLIDTSTPIADICYECGFNNLSNFNRIFKKKKNCSPKEFRENFRLKKKVI